jgi:hypothetical protein
MPEDLHLLRFSISHYQELLKLRSATIAQGAVERRLFGLLAEAMAELPLAEAAASNRNHEAFQSSACES